MKLEIIEKIKTATKLRTTLHEILYVDIYTDANSKYESEFGIEYEPPRDVKLYETQYEALRYFENKYTDKKHHIHKVTTKRHKYLTIEPEFVKGLVVIFNTIVKEAKSALRASRDHAVTIDDQRRYLIDYSHCDTSHCLAYYLSELAKINKLQNCKSTTGVKYLKRYLVTLLKGIIDDADMAMMVITIFTDFINTIRILSTDRVYEQFKIGSSRPKLDRVNLVTLLRQTGQVMLINGVSPLSERFYSLFDEQIGNIGSRGR